MNFLQSSKCSSTASFILVFLSWQTAAPYPADSESGPGSIGDYQPLLYSRPRLRACHQRVQEGLDSSLVLSFQAFGRHLHLRLFPEKNVFSTTHQLHYSNGTVQNVDTSHLYRGTVQGQTDSFAHLSLLEGQAQGYIRLPDSTLHIEPAARFFASSTFHSLIYLDIKDQNAVYVQQSTSVKMKFFTDSSCSTKVPEDSLTYIVDRCNKLAKLSNRSAIFECTKSLSSKKCGVGCRKDHKASTVNLVCNLHLFADPTLWTHFRYHKFQRVLSNEEVKNAIMKMFANHVSELKRVFGRTVFQTYDGHQSWSGLDFLVERSTIMTAVTERCGTAEASPFCEERMSPSAFLALASAANHQEFCLAAFFTSREFGPLLGLAGRGLATGPPVGVCGRFNKYKDGLFSGNTLVLTTLHHRRSLPERFTQLTFVHEVGHSFGSPHDDGADCAPGEDSFGGNYIMHEKPSPFHKEHNDKFSDCSKDNITRLLSAILRGHDGRHNCFRLIHQ